VSVSETPLVSVVIPAFNAAGLVGQTLESLRLQTFQNFEALIVDDGSTDATAAVVQEFCNADRRFSLMRRPHAGLPATRNAGMEQARGEFIAFLDADDLWLPEKLERQMKLFRADPRVNFSYTNFYFWDGTRDLQVHYRPRRQLPDGDPARPLAESNVFGISTVIVRREMLAPDFLFDTRLINGCEDWDLFLRLAERGLWTRGTREPLVRYRRWPGNMSNQKSKMVECDVQVLEKNLRATKRRDLLPIYRRSLNLASARLELIRARRMLDDSPEKVSATIWRAWRFYPRRLKWLMWFLLVAWPKSFGGLATQRIVHRKLIQKF
jgi:glycosyltransferase involved in cell wall biosynthesis